MSEPYWEPLAATPAAAALPADTVVPAATRIISNKLLAGDAQPAWRVLGDGKMQWGVGGSTAPETTLYRSGNNILKTDGAFVAAEVRAPLLTCAAPSAASFFLSAYASGDSYGRFQIGADGKHLWGPGNADTDTSLYRSSATIMSVGGSLRASQDVAANAASGFGTNSVAIGHSGGGYAACILFGGDTTIWRHSTGLIRFDGYGVLMNGGAATYYGDTGTYINKGGGNIQTNTMFGSLKFNCRNGEQNGFQGNGFNFGWGGNVDVYIDSTYMGYITLGSDGRYKKQIKPLPSTWEVVKALNPVSYRWRNKGVFRDDGRRRMGFLAQEIEELFPEGVSKAPPDDDGKVDPEQPMGLDSYAIMGTLCKALQEAMARIEALEAT